MNCNDTQKYIFRFYIKSILNEPNIKNMISFRGVNHTFKYYMDYFILNYQELIFNIIDDPIDFYSNYIHMFNILILNSKKYNSYITKIKIFNLIYIIKNKNFTNLILKYQNPDYKYILRNKLIKKMKLVFNKIPNINLVFANLHKYNNYISNPLKI